MKFDLTNWLSMSFDTPILNKMTCTSCTYLTGEERSFCNAIPILLVQLRGLLTSFVVLIFSSLFYRLPTNMLF